MKILIVIIAASLPVAIAVTLQLVDEYRRDAEGARHASLVAAQAIAYQHMAQVEGIRNLLVSMSHLPEVKSLNGPACTTIIRKILQQSPSTLNIGLADTTGAIVATGVPGRFSIGDRKYFRDALETKRFSAGEYTISRAVGKPAIHFALPVLNTEGVPISVLYATFDLSLFNGIFNAQKLPPNSVLNLSDHKGVVIYRYPQHPAVKPGTNDRPDLRRHVTGPKEEGVFHQKGLDGIQRLLAFKRVRLYQDDPPYLYIRVTIPEEVAFENARRLIVVSVATFLIAALTALAAIWHLSRRFLVEPVEQLARVAEAVTAGDLSVRTGIVDTGKGLDELGRLACSVDTMTRALAFRLHERDQAMMQLCASEEKLHAIFNHMNDAVFIHEIGTGRIIEVNQAMCTMFGYTREEAPYINVEAISHGAPPYSGKEAMDWIALAAQGQPQLFEWLSRHRDGRLFWTEISMRRATIGTCDCLIVLVRDISERKEAETDKLILTEQLNQAHRMESIGRLAGGIAHDFNNLLTPIIACSGLLQRELDEPRALDRVKRISEAAGRAQALTKQLLSFGRKQHLEMHVLDLNAVVVSFVEILHRTIRESIEIRLSLADRLDAIRGDRTQIEQVIMNLVVNAQDAISDIGSITIETACVLLDEEALRNHRDAEPGAYVMLAVSDDGCGMDQEKLSHIFEPFFTTKAVGKGTGLGLATAYGIVKQHGGNTWVYSEEGKGSTFKFFFPSLGSISAAVESRPEMPPAAKSSGAKILLVEDNVHVREIVKELLQIIGHDVTDADSPSLALQLAEGKYDLLVTDVVMPELSGPALYQQLQERHPGLKVLFMSGYTDHMIVRQGELPEGAAFIQKPFAAAELERRIADILATTDTLTAFSSI